MSGLFKNKNVLITGASSGIGLATAEEFVEEGAFVTLIDYSEDIKKIANKLKCKYLKIDLSKKNSYQRVSLFVKNELKKIDILINNAGVGLSKTLQETKDIEIEKIFNINLFAILKITRELIPFFRTPGAKIVNVSSIFGISLYPSSLIYSSSKSALNTSTYHLASELGALGINVNAVAPGVIKTPMTFDRIEKDKYYNLNLIESTPLKRYGDVKEVSSVICFLSSEKSSFVNGQVISVDGGWTNSRCLPNDSSFFKIID